MTPRPLLALLLLALTLPGCAAITSLSDAAQPLQIYELRAPEPPVAVAGRTSVEIVVDEPVASGSLATERIMIRPAELQAQYLPGVRWADPAPAMLQTVLVRTLIGTDAFASVGRRPIGSRADFALLTELTAFQAENMGDGTATTVEIGLIVRLVREADASVVATRTFTASEPALSADPDAVVAAFDRALLGLLAEMAPWVASRAGALS